MILRPVILITYFDRITFSLPCYIYIAGKYEKGTNWANESPRKLFMKHYIIGYLHQNVTTVLSGAIHLSRSSGLESLKREAR